MAMCLHLVNLKRCHSVSKDGIRGKSIGAQLCYTGRASGHEHLHNLVARRNASDRDEPVLRNGRAQHCAQVLVQVVSQGQRLVCPVACLRVQ